MSDWKPYGEGSEEARQAEFAARQERAPWGRWLIGIVFLLLIAGGALWLASKVVVPDDVPRVERTQKADQTPDQPQTPAPKSADDAAWVKALEVDTLEGYRDYLSAFPEGRHKEDALRLIKEYDDKAWARAQERDTIPAYEDYLKSWPEGAHVNEARERITAIKAARDAAAKAAAEAARRDAQGWAQAAQINTVASYETYVSKFPTGAHVDDAHARIARLKTTQAEMAAWSAARSANRVEAYQQYLSSFPQGAHAGEALAAIENLRPSAGKTFKDCDDCPLMVSLPAGTATLGALETDPDVRAMEKPARPVSFANMFAVSVTEVSFAQYSACARGGGCGSLPSDNGWGGGSRPVINVSWSEAVAYAQWLSNKTGKSYSLPTEAQWEYAARGGDKGVYPGGSTKALCAFANGASAESGLPWANGACTDMAADRTVPGGILSANGFGVKDMIGNVSEWVMDCNTLNLRDAPTDGGADQRGSCNQRVVRGGSWFSGPADLRYAARSVLRRGDSNDFTGFRVVRN